MEKKTGREKKKNIRRRNYLVGGGEEKRKRKRRKIFGGGKYFEKGNIWSTEEEKHKEGEGGIIWRRKINGDANQPTKNDGAFSSKTL